MFWAEDFWAPEFWAENFWAGFGSSSFGGNAAANANAMYEQKTKKQKKELAALMRELYDMSPDP